MTNAPCCDSAIPTDSDPDLPPDLPPALGADRMKIRANRQAGSVRASLEPCLVLHHRPWRETSAIVEMFAAESGRIGVVARGGRRPSSPFRGLLQPFIPLLGSWRGRGDLATLTGIEADGPPSALTGQALFGGLYLNELLMRLLHRHDPHAELFISYRGTLDRLSQGEPVEPTLRVFEKYLLADIGYGLVLDREVESGEPIEGDMRYDYVAEIGPKPVSGPPASGHGVQVSGRTLLALAKERFDAPDEVRESKRLMRYLLSELLGDRPLAVRALFERQGGARS